ncbi:replicative DNA helicase [Candidatus Desulforudis audaxviator]|uniref:Replicative DNA helicase n=1 Tax=Desulforudis audaxviator (strain MP104C) TaxID=477974 RepID=B1I6Q0_DESAP|nr:replicative DNA helicase [Candidatus Desulforudis audaxviator]ACA60698.1 replicative DNA helicase [Candidatus Desulforudis audaxviator MP104C]AZK60782.1 Replicative DNA helicase [Candidatus Desulforudis audaxviator]
MELKRIPPQNIDAEQAVLGALFLEPEAFYRVADIIRPGDFYQHGHRLIYEAVVGLQEEGQPVDLVTVTDRLRRDGVLEKVGGAAYVASLVEMVPAATNIEYYARIIEEKALLRTLISVAARISEMGYDEREAADRLVDQAEQMIMELGARRTPGTFVPLKDILARALERIEQTYLNKGRIAGVPTGFVDLDRLCSGLQPTDLIILAARPSMGKTALALNIAYEVAARQGLPVALFSLEMGKEQLVNRLLCAEARVDQHRLRTGNLRDEDWERLTEAAAQLQDVPLFIDDTGGASLRDIRARAKRLQAERGLALVIIDYVQLMQPNRRAENRQQEIAQISRGLKELAKELDVPVLALSQLSRAVEQRQEKRPQMSDLRESGSLEQDADVVLFIYREEYYRPETDRKAIAEIIVAKQRNGPVGTVELGFFKEFPRFFPLRKEPE